MKAQGATEYLVNLGVVLVIVLVVVAVLMWPTGATKDVTQSQIDIKCGIAKNAVPDIMSGMLAYYKFDEGSGTLTYNRKTGTSATLTNSPTWTIGKSGKALLFDGINNYVDLPDNGALDFSNQDFTVSSWANLAAYYSAGTICKTSPIVANDDYGWNLRIGSTGLPIFRIYHSSLNSSSAQATANVSLGVFHHYVGVFSPSTNSISLYVDGALAAQNGSIASGAGYYAGVDSPHIGAITGCGSQDIFFNGTIDEVLIYNRALSADEIKYLYEYPGCP